jgi:hypothetical protein
MDNKTNDKLTEYKNTIGYENLDVKIENGSMVITPSEAGVAIFSYIEMNEKLVESAEKSINFIEEKLDKVSSDNAHLIDLLERALDFLEDEKDSDKLVADILNTIYPITAIWDNGEEIKFNSDGTQVNK